jgi:hypothetical protein
MTTTPLLRYTPELFITGKSSVDDDSNRQQCLVTMSGCGDGAWVPYADVREFESIKINYANAVARLESTLAELRELKAEREHERQHPLMYTGTNVSHPLSTCEACGHWEADLMNVRRELKRSDEKLLAARADLDLSNGELRKADDALRAYNIQPTNTISGKCDISGRIGYLGNQRDTKCQIYEQLLTTARESARQWQNKYRDAVADSDRVTLENAKLREQITASWCYDMTTAPHTGAIEVLTPAGVRVVNWLSGLSYVNRYEGWYYAGPTPTIATRLPLICSPTAWRKISI